MESDTVIHVENLAKRYLIQHKNLSNKKGGGKMLSERMHSAAKSIWGRFFCGSGIETSRATSEEFWALKDVSFDVRRGEVLGIVGRNGAGKSTLLKLLSRITEPSRGEIRIKGRVASLLEVGTGFHPELTGRENVFLNGAILGMTREHIRAKFDEIVAFAEIEKFLDTPVKYYSSGMYVRLAFAVAAHLEPDILIVDEVLAVGDMAFQKKCLASMEETTKQGRTVLLVSHNMPTVLSLCTRAVLLSGGMVAAEGSPVSVLETYQNAYRDGSFAVDTSNSDCRLLRAWIGTDSSASQRSVPMSEAFDIQIEYEVLNANSRNFVPYVQLDTDSGQCVFHVNPENISRAGEGRWRAACTIPGWMLNVGGYQVTFLVVGFSANSYDVCLNEPSALSFTVVEDVPHPGRYAYAGHVPGAIWPCLEWKVNKQDSPPLSLPYDSL